jgi:hypothetical protein
MHMPHDTMLTHTHAHTHTRTHAHTHTRTHAHTHTRTHAHTHTHATHPGRRLMARCRSWWRMRPCCSGCWRPLGAHPRRQQAARQQMQARQLLLLLLLPGATRTMA